jgi:hypothetical protein
MAPTSPPTNTAPSSGPSTARRHRVALGRPPIRAMGCSTNRVPELPAAAIGRASRSGGSRRSGSSVSRLQVGHELEYAALGVGEFSPDLTEAIERPRDSSCDGWHRLSPYGFGFASVGRVRCIGHERYEPGRQAVMLTPLAFQLLIVTLRPITAPTSVSRLRAFEPHLYGTVSAIHWLASGETQRRDAQIARIASARPAALTMSNVGLVETSCAASRRRRPRRFVEGR